MPKLIEEKPQGKGGGGGGKNEGGGTNKTKVAQGSVPPLVWLAAGAALAPLVSRLVKKFLEERSDGAPDDSQQDAKVGWCKLDPGLKAPAWFQKFNLTKRNMRFNSNPYF